MLTGVCGGDIMKTLEGAEIMKNKPQTENERLIAESADMQYYKGCLGIYIGIWIFLMVFSLFAVLFTLLGKPDFSAAWTITGWLVLVLLYSVVFAPFAMYYLYRIHCLKKDIESYFFYEVRLENAHSVGRALCFSVTIKDENGVPVNVDTKAIFAVGGFVSPLFDDYNNKIVKIGYNPNSGDVVVVKRDA